MNYDKLEKTYWDDQLKRIEEVRAKIAARQEVVSEGRVVPEDAALTIGTGRRMGLAVMYIDICDSSSRASETLAEQDKILRTYDLFFTEMIRISEEYGGTVEKNTGDGLMAYFEDAAGNPPAECCKRAVSCALSMMFVTEQSINYILEASSIPKLRFRVSIDFGPTTIAQIGAQKRFGNRVAIGNTANLANKMMKTAAPNDILIGENVAAKLPQDWRNTYCQLLDANTGYMFASDRRPYRYYRYTGRWRNPQ